MPRTDKYNVDRTPKRKFPLYGNEESLTPEEKKDLYYKAPLTEEEFFAKYGNDAEKAWDDPSGPEQLEDRFGEEIWSLEDDDIIAKYGEDILYAREDALNEIYDEQEKIKEENKKAFEKKFEEKIKSDKKVDDDLLIKINKEDESIEDSIEESVEESVEKSVEEEKIDEQSIMDSLLDSSEDKMDDADYANFCYDMLEESMDKGQIVGWQKMVGSGNTPKTIQRVDDNSNMWTQLRQYENEQKGKNPNFVLTSIENKTAYLYETVTDKYKAGRYPSDDAERLRVGARYYAQVQAQHNEHGIGYFFRHPINYLTEWNVLRKMNNLLQEKGFTATQIKTAVDTQLAEMKADQVLGDELDKQIENLENAKKEQLSKEPQFETQKDLTKELNDDFPNTNINIDVKKLQDEGVVSMKQKENDDPVLGVKENEEPVITFKS